MASAKKIASNGVKVRDRCGKLVVGGLCSVTGKYYGVKHSSGTSHRAFRFPCRRLEGLAPFSAIPFVFYNRVSKANS
jgi:hypothetical protein